jgi:hypothetical protein
VPLRRRKEPFARGKPARSDVQTDLVAGTGLVPVLAGDDSDDGADSRRRDHDRCDVHGNAYKIRGHTLSVHVSRAAAPLVRGIWDRRRRGVCEASNAS